MLSRWPAIALALGTLLATFLAGWEFGARVGESLLEDPAPRYEGCTYVPGADFWACEP